MKKIFVTSVLILIIATTGFAAETPGAAGALAQETYTIEDMLHYAIQDEWLAEAEYTALMEEFEVTRPFSNIQKAELTHIDLLLPLFESYGIKFPEKPDLAIIPETLEETYQIGVDAEIANIAMYEKFLADPTLPADISSVFTRLMNASKNHLNAFQRQVDRSTEGFSNQENRFGRGRQNRRSQF
jgi:hypothetical protein